MYDFVIKWCLCTVHIVNLSSVPHYRHFFCHDNITLVLIDGSVLMYECDINV